MPELHPAHSTLRMWIGGMALKFPSEPKPEDVVAIIDSREQLPYDLSPLRSETGTLATGDYSIKGLEHVVAIERKSLGDLISCVGSGRERFDKEIQRLLAYPVRCVVVEANFTELAMGQWRGRVQPSSAIGSVLGWIAMGVPFLFAGCRSEAQQSVSRMLYIAARRRWREARQLIQIVTEGND